MGMGIIVLSLSMFVGGVYAAQNGWLNFTGEKKASDTKNNINEILDILNDVGSERDNAEGKVENLENAKDKIEKELNDLTSEHETKVDELENEIDRLEKELENNQSNNAEIEHLKKELKKANNITENVYNESDSAVKNARQYKRK